MPTVDLSNDFPHESLHHALTVAEYQALRAQILQLEALQARLVTFTAIAFGAVVSVGFQAESALIVLVHPVLALVLGVNWMSYAHHIQRTGNYLRRLERRLRAPYLGWEMYVLTDQPPASWIGFVGVRSIFALSAVLAMVASLAIEIPRDGTLIVLSASAAVTVALVLLTVLWQERIDQPSTSPLAPGPFPTTRPSR